MQARDIVVSGYDRIAEDYLEWTVASPLREHWLALLAEDLPRGGRVLDLGCGAGIPVATRLIEKGFSVVGIDSSSSQIKLARQNAPEGEFHVGDMTAATFEPATFDAVTAFYSIIHLPRAEHGAMFARVLGWLRPGGLFLATLGYGDCPDWTGDWFGVPMFYSHFDKAKNISLLDQAGFEILRNKVISEIEHGEMAHFLWVIARKPA